MSSGARYSDFTQYISHLVRTRLLVGSILLVMLQTTFAESLTKNPYYKDIGSKVGVLAFEFLPVRFDEDSNYVYGEIWISRKVAGTPIQRLSVDYYKPRGFAFDFVDLNSDGYLDLLFWNEPAGHSGANMGATVFIWAPEFIKELGKYSDSSGEFIKNKELSGRGDIQLSRRKGCVTVIFKSSATGWTTEEWCSTPQSMEWRLDSRQIDEPS